MPQMSPLLWTLIFILFMTFVLSVSPNLPGSYKKYSKMSNWVNISNKMKW